MNKSKKTIFAFITVLVIILVYVISLTENKSKNIDTLRIAHPLDPSHPLHRALEHFAKRTGELSRGSMRVLIYPNGQLGSDRECLEQLQYGILSMGITSCGPLEGFVPGMQIFGIPYVFRSREHMINVLDGPIGSDILASGEKYGLKGLCFYDAGAMSFYTKDKPVYTPVDLAGLKIRVMKTTMSIKTMKALGALPTPIDFGELYTALQQGVVDGAENNPPSFMTSMHYEICRYYSLDEHLRIPDILLVSTLFWEKLSPQQQRIVQQAAVESAYFQRAIWQEFTQTSLEKVQSAGVEVISPQKELFIEAVRPLWQSFEGTSVGTMIQKIQDVQ